MGKISVVRMGGAEREDAVVTVTNTKIGNVSNVYTMDGENYQIDANTTTIIQAKVGDVMVYYAPNSAIKTYTGMQAVPTGIPTGTYSVTMLKVTASVAGIDIAEST